MKRDRNSLGILFDAFFGIFLITSIIWVSIDYTMVSIFTPVLALLLGGAFTSSATLKDKSHIANGFYWFSQHLILPRTRYNHLVAGYFLIVVGVLSAVMPNSTNLETDAALWKSLVRRPSFWILLLGVCVFNGIVGVYRYRSHKRRNEAREQP